MACDPSSSTPERRTLTDRRGMSRGGRRRSDAVAFEHALRSTEIALHKTVPGSAPLALVVDDFLDGREMVCEYLRYRGFRVVEAATGREAVEKTATFLPDVVLLDLRMPDMDGLEVLARLRKGPHRQVKVAIFTAHVQVGVRQRV